MKVRRYSSPHHKSCSGRLGWRAAHPLQQPRLSQDAAAAAAAAAVAAAAAAAAAADVDDDVQLLSAAPTTST